MKLRFVAVPFLLAAAIPAHAEWRQAKTEHFVLTIDETEAGARAYAANLERYDAALRQLYGLPDDPDRRARPVSVFVFKGPLFYDTCRCAYVLGYYRARTQGPVIFSLHMPEADQKAKAGRWSSQAVLLHEYGHHFMFTNYPIAYPDWFTEGFAEFNANASFEKDGSVVIGYPANYRAESLEGGRRLSPEQFFEPQRYGIAGKIDVIYASGWLLTHYLMLKPARNAQLPKYLDGINKGKAPLTAANEAFGDLNTLYAELDAYRRDVLAPPLRVSLRKPLGQPTVRLLSKGEAAMLPVYSMYATGASKSGRVSLAMRAAGIASRYPDDPAVQIQLAEIEFMARRFDRAERAADAVLTADPGSSVGMLYKGLALLEAAHDAKIADPAVWAMARSWIQKANRADPDATLPLFHYYRSFALAGAAPTAAAVKALLRAHVLAPESEPIRLAVVRRKIAEGDLLVAKELMQPLAYAPHKARLKNRELEAYNLLEQDKHREADAILAKIEIEEAEDDA